MKSLFNSQILRKKPNQTHADPEGASAAPTFYHLPPTGAPASNDPYSHTSNSTAGYAHTSAYPTLPSQNPSRERLSLIDRIEARTTNLLGSVVGEDHAVSLAHRVNTTVSNGRDARELLRNGAIVQFVSKNSGHLLQVVMCSQNTLTFDGCGAANSFNTYFTVEESGNGRLRFHNSYNYLAFHEKQPSILTLPPGPKNIPNIEFRVHNIVGTNELVAFESYAYKNCFISIAADGFLKTSNIKDKTIEAQFSVVPIPLVHLPTQVGPRQPFGPSTMSPYNSLPLQNTAPPASSQPPPYSVEPSAPPAPSHFPSSSSSLYPKFN